MTTLTVIQRKSGTYSLVLKRPDAPAQLWRSGIPTESEAVKRARIVADMCGYRVKRA